MQQLKATESLIEEINGQIKIFKQADRSKWQIVGNREYPDHRFHYCNHNIFKRRNLLNQKLC
jgi:hypothetical protein